MKIDISNVVNSINKVTTEELTLEMSTFESKLGTFPILKKSPIALRIENQVDVSQQQLHLMKLLKRL